MCGRFSAVLHPLRPGSKMDNGASLVQHPEVVSLLRHCDKSTGAFCKAFFPDRFHRPFSPIQGKIFEVLDDDTIQQAVIMAPRGWGKTSTVNLGYPAKRMLLPKKPNQFIVNISCTAAQAVMQSENLKRELVSNPLVTKIFGQQKTSNWSKEQWATSLGTFYLPRGNGQQVRGILYRNERPNLILVDDLEDAEAVRSEEQREKLFEWFSADVLNSVDRGSHDWRVIVIGTLLHEDSLLARLVEDPNWHDVRIGLCDTNYKSLWPEFMSSEEILELRDEYAAKGQLDVFYREYMNLPISVEDASFRQSYFKYYNESEFRQKVKFSETVVIIDAAKTVKPHSDFSSIIAISADLINQAFYVRDLVVERLHPDEIVNIAFGMAQQLGAHAIGYETTSLHEFIDYPLKNELRRRGLNIELVPLAARGKKGDRIAALIPLYRQGYIYHNPTVCGPLEQQLLSFPRSKFDDAMDSMAYLIEMFETGERYFRASELADEALADAELRALEEEEMAEEFDDISGWRLS